MAGPEDKVRGQEAVMTVTLPLAVTMGEPAGIGGDTILKAWAGRAENGVPPFFVVDDPARLEALARRLGLDVPVHRLAGAGPGETGPGETGPGEAGPGEVAELFATALPVLPLELPGRVEPGHPDPANGLAVIASIDRAMDLVRDHAAAALVTSPIHKSVLYRAGFSHPGHTEYLAARAGCGEPPVMMLEGGGLRVVLATIHLSLRDAAAALDSAAIVHVGRVAAAALVRDFGIASPRLVVAALNPHAGEDGALGREEIDIIAPAVAALRALGIAVAGPRPADTLFHAAARAGYDAAICMYHDQGLIPLKTLDFETGVNITLGLPFVRTSPDHGTALDIAGTGRASPSSLVAAMKTAARMAGQRSAQACD
jgi:4-hydroxythreonine-4-phosphate dehydrogenase